MRDDDVIDLGNRKIKAIHTPGHSPGHCCFYEEDRKYLYSGDLIYAGCLDAFYPTTDPFAFMQSVNKIKKPIKNYNSQSRPKVTELLKRYSHGKRILKDIGSKERMLSVAAITPKKKDGKIICLQV